MFVPKSRYLAAFASLLMGLASLSDSARAQSVRDAMNQRNARQRVGANAVPLRTFPGIGDARFIPSDVTRRSTEGVPGFSSQDAKTSGKTRVQIGGVNGSNVVEQVVNATNSPNLDQRTPFWSSDESSLYTASKLKASEGYQITRLAANPGATNNGPAAEVALTNEPAADHLFPTIDPNGGRIAYIKSTDGKSPDDPTKQWHLYAAFVPSSGTIDTAPGGASQVQALTMGRTFRGRGFDSVGRVAWVGTTQLVFSARLIGDSAFHLFLVSLSQFTFEQLTDGPGSEMNPSVSPNFNFVAFDSNATPTTAGTSYSNGTAPATETSAGDPARAASVSALRNVFTMLLSGTAPPVQFSGRYAGAPAVNNVQPAWSGSRQNPFTNTGGNRQYLAFSSNRQATSGGVVAGSNSDIFIVPATQNGGNTLLSENAAATAVKLDTADPTFAFDDQYPAWSPFINLTRLAMQSDRTGSLRVNSFGIGFTQTPNLRDILMASAVDINAPSLVRFDTSSGTGEIVHINLGGTYNSAGSVRVREDGLVPGGQAFFTVRCEDREAGLRDDADPNGGAVYLQFKNPNSIFQSIAQGGPATEFKEYTQAFGDPFTVVEALNGANIPASFVDNSTGVGPGYEFDAKVLDSSGNFLSHTINGGPVYTPGISDATAFTGTNNPPLDGVHSATNCWIKLNKLSQLPADGQGGVLYGAAVTLPSISSDWFVDVVMYDNAVNPYAVGGSGRGNWIIYDNIWGFSTASAPNATLDQDILFVSDYGLGQKFFTRRFGQNSRPINQQPIFFGAESYLTDTDLSRFPGEFPSAGGPAATRGIPAPPVPVTGAPTPRFYANHGPFFHNDPNVAGPQGSQRANGGVVVNPTYPNPLGVGSYWDRSLDFTPSITLSNGFRYALPTTGRYSIWRILSRGAVPQGVVDAYLPKSIVTPADGLVGETAPRNTRIWNRMVVWSSPFAGNLFVGAGGITDLRTQDQLSRYVRAGGRLFITGNDIGFAIAGNGQANDFFQNVLQATFVRDQATPTPPVPLVPTGATLVTRDPFRNGNFARQYGGRTTGDGNFAYLPPSSDTVPVSSFAGITGTADRGDGSPVSSRDGGFNDQIAVIASPANLDTAGLRTRTDFTYQGAGAIITSEYALNPNQALNPADPYAAERKFTSGGSATYSSIGLESVSQDFYSYTPSGANPAYNVLASLGRRAEIMANVVGAYRTGTIQGRVIDDTGSPVAGALMRAVRRLGEENLPAWGTAISDGGGNFVISGLPSESYIIFGYIPGFYTQHTSGVLVQGGGNNRADLQLKRAGPGRLQNIASAVTTPSGILDTAGKAIPSIEVQLRRTEPTGAITTVSALSVAGDPLTPAGSYSFDSLLIGQYDIYVNWATIVDSTGAEVTNPRYNANYSSIHVTTDPQTGVVKGPGTVLVPPTVGTGIRLAVSEAQTATMNFVLESAPQDVNGKVIDSATNAGISGANVALADKASGTVVATATADANGNYQLKTVATPVSTKIPPGTYVLSASALGYGNGSVDPFVVNGTTAIAAPTIALTKVPPGGVRGLITGPAGNGGLAGVTVKLFYIKSDGTEDPNFQQATSTASVTASNGFVYNYDFPLGNVPAGDYILRFEKDGLASDPVQIRITVASSAITYVSTSAQMKAPRTFGNGMQLLSVPYDYSGIFPASQPGSIFSLSATGDNDGDGTANTANDQALYSQFNVADWTGLDYKIGNTIPILVGKGYFIKFGGVTPVSRTGTGVASSTFTLNLTPGWNLIGNPFANKTSASALPPDLDINTDVTVQDGAATPVTMAEAVRLGLVKSSVFAYSGSENNAQYLQTTVLKPWLGYWFRNNTNREIRLVFTYPIGRSVTRFQVAKTITRAEAEAVTPRQFTSTGVQDWRLQISARQGNLADTDNSIGVSRTAKDGYDNQFDTPKPPALTQVPSLYVALGGVDGAGRAVPFADVIHAPGAKKSWEMTVTPGKNGDVTLYWPNVNRLPREIQPTLIDTATGRRVNLRSAASYKFAGTVGATRSFKIEVAAARTAPLAIYGTRVTTITGTRGIASGYRFAFIATQEADIQAEVKSLTGRTLRVLQTRAVPGQETSLFWDGKSAQSAPLPAGTYVLTLTAKDEAGNVVRQSLPLTTIR